MPTIERNSTFEVFNFQTIYIYYATSPYLSLSENRDDDDLKFIIHMNILV